ncbi:hypothetical protein BTR23_21080 [Alkalihalophilus pseudofirmus]|nr:hypothetical protein BTR23_21080 [Alkalihalophilus pseudofirmus]
MFNEFEKNVLRFLLTFGLIAVPISIIGKDYRKWMKAFLLNGYANTFVAPLLERIGFLKYPVRILPKVYQSSILYDYCLCSLVTTWYCRMSLKDNWKIALIKVWFFALPQAIAEWWLEKNTQLIKYNKGWTWVHSLMTIAIAKYMVRSSLVAMDFYDIKKLKQNNIKKEPV